MMREARHFRRYRIEGIVQEAECGQCGMPLYVGDAAYEHKRKTGDYPVCSVACGVAYEARVKADCERDGICPEHGDTLPGCFECIRNDEADVEARAALGDYFNA
jgi:hypothetical protein